jgi:hypothetical protein
MVFFPTESRKIFLASISLVFMVALTGCGPQSSLESSTDELEFTSLISGSEECSSYPYGDSISLQTEFINTTAQPLNEDSFSQLQEQGYTAVFYQENWEINGIVVISDETINAGELGTMYLGFTRGDLYEDFTEVTRIEVLKDSKVLLNTDVSIDLDSLCIDSKF